MKQIIMAWTGGPSGPPTHIDENVQELLGLTPEQARARWPITVPLSPGGECYDRVLREEMGKQSPRLSCRLWVEINGDESIEFVALFLRDDGGRVVEVTGAAWRLIEHCSICSALLHLPAELRQAILCLAKDASAELTEVADLL